MRKFILLIGVFLLSFQLQAQISGISVSGGLGSYDMSDSKEYQVELINRLPASARQFNSFPLYTSFKLVIFKELASGFSYGLNYAYSNTGTHANYRDFSGELNLDQVMRAYQMGLSASYQFLSFFVRDENEFDFSVYGDFRLGYIRQQVELLINTSYFYENNSLILTGLTPLTEFGLQSTIRLSKISIGIEGGYLVDFGSRMNAGTESIRVPSFSILPANEIKSNISGIRFGLRLIFWIKPALDF